jgi:hypothetical protein
VIFIYFKCSSSSDEKVKAPESGLVAFIREGVTRYYDITLTKDLEAQGWERK